MVSVKVEMTGMAQLVSQLAALGVNVDEVLEQVALDLATDTQAFAIAGIQGGGKSGRVYEKYIPRRTHQASAPGQYPASDTGILSDEVRAVPDGPGTYRVGTNVLYGPMLEFGTSRMAARPWLLPSFERARIGVEAGLKAKLEALL